MAINLITGITGQDGYILAKQLLELNQRVVGTTRTQKFDNDSLDDLKLHNKFELVDLDVSNRTAVERIIEKYIPDFIYHLAGYTSGSGMYDLPHQMAMINGLATVNFLEAIRNFSPQSRMVFASSSEIFGFTNETPQNEKSTCMPRSPYGAAKLYSQNMLDIWRHKYGLNLKSAILYNHESDRRSDRFVSKKIVKAAVNISLGLQDKLRLGDLSAKRDWGYAPDFTYAMRKIAEAEINENFIVASGISRTVGELCKITFQHVGLDYTNFVINDSNLIRNGEKIELVGDTNKIKTLLKWRPSVLIEQWTKKMVDAEMQRVTNK